MRPQRRVALEVAQNRALDRRIQILDDGAWRRDRRLVLQPDEFSHVGGDEGAAPGEELVQHQSERIEIALDRRRLPGQ